MGLNNTILQFENCPKILDFSMRKFRTIFLYVFVVDYWSPNEEISTLIAY